MNRKYYTYGADRFNDLSDNFAPPLPLFGGDTYLDHNSLSENGINGIESDMFSRMSGEQQFSLSERKIVSPSDAPDFSQDAQVFDFGDLPLEEQMRHVAGVKDFTNSLGIVRADMADIFGYIAKEGLFYGDGNAIRQDHSSWDKVWSYVKRSRNILFVLNLAQAEEHHTPEHLILPLRAIGPPPDVNNAMLVLGNSNLLIHERITRANPSRSAFDNSNVFPQYPVRILRGNVTGGIDRLLGCSPVSDRIRLEIAQNPVLQNTLDTDENWFLDDNSKNVEKIYQIIFDEVKRAVLSRLDPSEYKSAERELSSFYRGRDSLNIDNIRDVNHGLLTGIFTFLLDVEFSHLEGSKYSYLHGGALVLDAYQQVLRNPGEKWSNPMLLQMALKRDNKLLQDFAS